MACIRNKTFLLLNALFHRSEDHSGKNHHKYKDCCQTEKRNGYCCDQHCTKIRDFPTTIKKYIFYAILCLSHSVTIDSKKTCTSRFRADFLCIFLCGVLINRRDPVQITVCDLAVFIFCHNKITRLKRCLRREMTFSISLRFLRGSLLVLRLHRRFCILRIILKIPVILCQKISHFIRAFKYIHIIADIDNSHDCSKHYHRGQHCYQNKFLSQISYHDCISR